VSEITAKTVRKACVRAGCKRIERYIYECYLYAEKHPRSSHLLDIMDEINIGGRCRDPVVIDHTIDLLAGRCKPDRNK
jgi:hypothetical protein